MATLVGAAGLIAVLTVLARLVGFGRIFVFFGTVGYTRVGSIYQTVNAIPNVVFELAAGGALASMVVPLLSTALARGGRAEADRTTSALLTWTVTVLTPLAVAAAVLADPIVRALLGPSASAADVAFGTRLLVVFAPQVVLYGVGMVLTGVVQAHHRFAGPALAPLLSSLTVAASYLLYAVVGGSASPAALSDVAAWVLAVGTTLGVAVLSLSLLVPLRRTGVRIRPTYRFPPGAARQARTLVGNGLAAVAGQQLALVVALKLCQRPAPDDAVVVYTAAQTIYLLPWAVLAVPLATSAFPRLTAAAAAGDRDGYAETLRAATQAVVVVTVLAAAALVAAAEPVAVVLTSVGQGGDSTASVAAAIALFAVGLPGYGLLAVLSRALYAAGVAAATALVTLTGWTVVIAASIVLAWAVPVTDRVPALAAGNSVGMVVLGAGLLALTARRVGRAGLAGTTRTAGVALAAGVVAGLAGRAVVAALPGGDVPGALGQGLAAGAVVVAGFAAVAVLLDRRQLRRLVGRPLAGRGRGKEPGT